MASKRKMVIVTRSQSNRYKKYGSSDELDPTPPKMKCLPLGYFSALPVELKEAIISFLPISSIINLASTSRSWLEFITAWVASKRVSQVMIAEIRRHRPLYWFFYSAEEEKRFWAWCTSFGGLVRVTTVLNQTGGATRILWLRRLMTELNLSWRSREIAFRGFRAFYMNCFKSSDPEELSKIVQVIITKIRMPTYIHTQLKYKAGMKKEHETKTRQIARLLFLDERFLAAFLRFFAEIDSCGQLKRLTSNEIARLIFVLYGPITTPNGSSSETIGWKVVTEPFVSLNSLASLADLLNMNFLRTEPFCIEDILDALLAGGDFKWSDNAIGTLFVNLNIDLSVTYLLKKWPPHPNVILAIGLHSPGMMKEILERLKSMKGEMTFQELCTNLRSAIMAEMKSQDRFCRATCGDCTNCPVCPMGNLERIRATTDSFSEPPLPVPVLPLRRSLRLQRQRGTV